MIRSDWILTDVHANDALLVSASYLTARAALLTPLASRSQAIPTAIPVISQGSLCVSASLFLSELFRGCELAKAAIECFEMFWDVLGMLPIGLRTNLRLASHMLGLACIMTTYKA